jgi:hypothetical protein
VQSLALRAFAKLFQNSIAPQTDGAEQGGSPQAPNANLSVEPASASQDPSTIANTMEGASEGMSGKSGIMNANGMMGQPGFGFPPNQGNFNGMGWNGMNPMNGMANMMPNGNWNNNMNPMGTSNYSQSCFTFCMSTNHMSRLQHDEQYERHV